MILVDKNIKALVANGSLIISGYKEENVNGISYDLTADVIIDENSGELIEYRLQPGETVFVRSVEQLSIPLNIMGRVAEKNSRMRQGLQVDGPHYQPGHVTYVFMRVQNISTDIILLSQGMKIAQMIFEELKEIPEVPYSSQANASFQNEKKYIGLGNYQEEYTKKMEKSQHDIENISQTIYANVLTIMGIIVAIFSLLTINFQAFASVELDFKYIIAMNLTLALCIVLMMGIILIFVNKAKNKEFLWLYGIVLVILTIATIVLSFFII